MYLAKIKSRSDTEESLIPLSLSSETRRYQSILDISPDFINISFLNLSSGDALMFLSTFSNLKISFCQPPKDTNEFKRPLSSLSKIQGNTALLLQSSSGPYLF